VEYHLTFLNLQLLLVIYSYYLLLYELLYGDWCFANSLEEKYSKEILEQAKKSLEGLKGSMPDNMD